MNARNKILAVLTALLVTLPVPGAAQGLIDDVVAFEKAEIARRCKTVAYGEDFATLIDFNNDKLVDVITNLGAVNCDGVDGGLCGNVGCPYNFYIRVSEGGYFLAASADLYGYEMKQRYGNMVLELKANGVSCGREGPDYCIMTIRVRGARFETISRK